MIVSDFRRQVEAARPIMRFNFSKPKLITHLVFSHDNMWICVCGLIKSVLTIWRAKDDDVMCERCISSFRSRYPAEPKHDKRRRRLTIPMSIVDREVYASNTGVVEDI